MKTSVADRFLRYVQIDTQSDPMSKTSPSAEKQKDLGRLLVAELKEIGIEDAHMDEYGYVYAGIPSNSSKNVPVICYCAHMDTAPDCSGTGVKPIVHKNYDGKDIVLPDDQNQVISTREHPYLKKKTGDDIITASGLTLLGADDKAGIAIIMDMASQLMTRPEIIHGAIKILFTTDEEIGHGVDHVDIKKLGADIGYTLDGSELGSFDDENFSADGMTIVFQGISAHPGQAKGKMVNAIKLASAFIDSLPTATLSPESTEERAGFVHPVRMEGTAETMTVEFIIRDFNTSTLAEYESLLKTKAHEAIADFPGAGVECMVKEQYRNMKEVLDKFPLVSAHAVEAIQRAGIAVKRVPARGGTDGSRLSFMGLPCPNIFTGEMAFHGKHEYVSIQDMEKSVETIIHLCRIWEENS